MIVWQMQKTILAKRQMRRGTHAQKSNQRRSESMTIKLNEVIVNVPYPKAAGSQYGYRVFDGNKWHDCDKNGKPQ